MRLRTFLGLLFILISWSGRSDGDPLTEANRHYHTGLAYERLGRFDESYTELQLATNLDPDHSSMAVALATVAARLGHVDEAQRALEHAIALDASSCAAYYELALIDEKNKLTDRALENWHRFAQLTQDDVLKDEAQKHIEFLDDAH